MEPGRFQVEVRHKQDESGKWVPTSGEKGGEPRTFKVRGYLVGPEGGRGDSVAVTVQARSEQEASHIAYRKHGIEPDLSHIEEAEAGGNGSNGHGAGARKLVPVETRPSNLRISKKMQQGKGPETYRQVSPPFTTKKKMVGKRAIVTEDEKMAGIEGKERVAVVPLDNGRPDHGLEFGQSVVIMDPRGTNLKEGERGIVRNWSRFGNPWDQVVVEVGHVAFQVPVTALGVEVRHKQDESGKWVPTSGEEGGEGGGGDERKKRTQAEMDAGLKSWVKDYQSAREAGNVKLAKSAKANIDGVIKDKDLDPDTVWGKDPDAPRERLARERERFAEQQARRVEADVGPAAAKDREATKEHYGKEFDRTRAEQLGRIAERGGPLSKEERAELEGYGGLKPDTRHDTSPEGQQRKMAEGVAPPPEKRKPGNIPGGGYTTPEGDFDKKRWERDTSGDPGPFGRRVREKEKEDFESPENTRRQLRKNTETLEHMRSMRRYQEEKVPHPHSGNLVTKGPQSAMDREDIAINRARSDEAKKKKKAPGFEDAYMGKAAHVEARSAPGRFQVEVRHKQDPETGNWDPVSGEVVKDQPLHTHPGPGAEAFEEDEDEAREGDHIEAVELLTYGPLGAVTGVVGKFQVAGNVGASSVATYTYKGKRAVIKGKFSKSDAKHAADCINGKHDGTDHDHGPGAERIVRGLRESYEE